MKKNLLLALLLFGSASVFAQDTTKNWTLTKNIGANFTQIGLKNWAGGGQNAVSVIGLFSGSAAYNKDDIAWESTLELGFGVTKLDTTPFRKSDDRIILLSKFTKGITTKAPLNYSAALDFRTQFAIGRDFRTVDSLGNSPKISNFFSPAYLILSLGIEYKPVDYFTMTLAPATGRIIFVLDEELSNAGAFGVDVGKTMNAELGWNFNAQFKKEIFENVTLQSRLNLFNAYENFGNLVVNSETLLLFKVNEYLNASFALDVFYDEKVQVLRDDRTVGPATQIRNTLALGFSYVL
ncbi:MAG: DUF3078 domain-containing protein [Chloroherpetonaceae bacterium]